MKRVRFLANRRSIVLILVATVILTVQCAQASPTATPNPGASPLSPVQVAVSPLDGPAAILEGFPFSIDEPLQAGDKRVEGGGPRQVGILIVDVTMMGEVLGRGQIGQDGRFSILVEPPLIVNHRIGLMLDGQSPGIVQTEKGVAQLDQFNGDNAITIPRVGRMYDAASVKE